MLGATRKAVSVHKSLTLPTNRVLIFCWLAGTTAIVVATSGAALIPCVVGAAFGVGAGVLQARALRSDPAGFAATTTALDVRRVLNAANGGKSAIAAGWVCGVALVMVAFSSGTRQLAPWNALGGYLTFMLVRDILAYPALRSVASVAAQPTTK
jgi:hypothetical protein